MKLPKWLSWLQRKKTIAEKKEDSISVYNWPEIPEQKMYRGSRKPDTVPVKKIYNTEDSYVSRSRSSSMDDIILSDENHWKIK